MKLEQGVRDPAACQPLSSESRLDQRRSSHAQPRSLCNILLQMSSPVVIGTCSVCVTVTVGCSTSFDPRSIDASSFCTVPPSNTGAECNLQEVELMYNPNLLCTPYSNVLGPGCLRQCSQPDSCTDNNSLPYVWSFCQYLHLWHTIACQCRAVRGK